MEINLCEIIHNFNHKNVEPYVVIFKSYEMSLWVIRYILVSFNICQLLCLDHHVIETSNLLNEWTGTLAKCHVTFTYSNHIGISNGKNIWLCS